MTRCDPLLSFGHVRQQIVPRTSRDGKKKVEQQARSSYCVTEAPKLRVFTITLRSPIFCGFRVYRVSSKPSKNWDSFVALLLLCAGCGQHCCKDC